MLITQRALFPGETASESVFQSPAFLLPPPGSLPKLALISPCSVLSRYLCICYIQSYGLWTRTDHLIYAETSEGLLEIR